MLNGFKIKLIINCIVLNFFLFITPVFAEKSKCVSQQEVLTTKPFFVIRHGETDYNVKGLFQGKLDIPLNEKGKKEVRKVAQALKGKGIKQIFSSPLSRAKETAEIIRHGLEIKAPVIVVPDLADHNWGGLEGKSIKANEQAFGPNFQPKGGEDLCTFERRAIKAILNIINKNDDGVLIVAHGSTLVALFHYIGTSEIQKNNAVPLRFIPPQESKEDWQIESIQE